MINYFWIEIKGKSLKRFLNTILNNNINILNIRYEKNKAILKVSYEDYNKIKKIKTTCQIKIIKTNGKKKIYEEILKYKTSIIVFIISIFLIVLLSNLTLYIKIDTHNINLKKQVASELKKNNITIFSFKKNYEQLNKITKKIKQRNDNIEWIEIENDGVITKVKIIERVKNATKQDKKYKDIIAEKNGYIRKIYSKKGELLKNIDDYVKKGEVIISGNIFRNDKLVAKTKAEGRVYAEVWYIVKLNEKKDYINLKKQKEGKKKLILNVLNKEINLFKIKKEVEKETKHNVFSNNIFSLYIKEEKTYKKEKEIYSDDELINILETRAKKNIEKTLEKDEYIINQKTLKKTKENGKIYLEVFFKVYENIAKETNIAKIEKEKEE